MSTAEINKINEELRLTIADKYGVEVGFIPMSEKDARHVHLLNTLKRNASAPLIVTHKSMVIPARKAGHLLGAVLIFGIISFEPYEIADVTNRVQNMLSDLLPAPYAAQSEKSNVIKLFA